MHKPSDRFHAMRDLFQQRQTDICHRIELLDSNRFVTDHWTRESGGGGCTRIIEGTCIEKGGVNTSEVFGTIQAEEQALFKQLVSKVDPSFEITNDASFCATGVSLVLHPKNPFVPTVHANFRYFECHANGRQIWWFGGGADLTPNYLFEDDVVHFHRVLRDPCEAYQKGAYKVYKEKCDRYFFIPHRQETRGVGGIFFDYLVNDAEAISHFVESVSDVFVAAYCPIVEARRSLSYTQEHTQWQQIRRGRYAEFNLVYDRGTLFGLKTGGRIESILMSLPPIAQWHYDYQPPEGSEESRLLAVLKSPREWL